jgi:hypothetical protein
VYPAECPIAVVPALLKVPPSLYKVAFPIPMSPFENLLALNPIPIEYAVVWLCWALSPIEIDPSPPPTLLLPICTASTC